MSLPPEGDNRPNGPDLLNYLSEQIARSAAGIKTVTELRAVLEQGYNTALEVEAKIAAVSASARGYETLTTDKADARPAGWFIQTGRAFSSGIASSCIAVAVSHDWVGMGAAHRNITGVEDIIQKIAAIPFHVAVSINPDISHLADF